MEYVLLFYTSRNCGIVILFFPHCLETSSTFHKHIEYKIFLLFFKGKTEDILKYGIIHVDVCDVYGIFT